MILELCFSPHRLGKTDLLVSTVGFGGCVVGGEYPDKGDLQEIIQVIEKLLLFIIHHMDHPNPTVHNTSSIS